MKDKMYLKIEKKDIPQEFNCVEEKRLFCLTYGRARPIRIKLPLVLNENMAKIAAMILDGSLSKNHDSVMFSQKKDLQKIKDFIEICQKTFNVKGRIDEKDGCLRVQYSNRTFAKFLHSCLDIHKSDEFARIPRWMWASPKRVLVAYLRYAFAMEGSVSSYFKGYEVKFHSCALPYLEELQELLKVKFTINSKIQRYYIKDYGYKYYLYMVDKENIAKFSKIGFALESHQKQLEKTVAHFKSKAWEITLVKILDIKNGSFSIEEVNQLFKYLGKRAVYERLKSLVALEHLSIDKQGMYHLTPAGFRKALSLKNRINITKLRTYPKLNEKRIVSYLKENAAGYRNRIARELKIHPSTVRDTLKRLVRMGKIGMVKVDKFQRKFYTIK